MSAMNDFFNRDINIAAVLKFNDITPPIQSHLARVYRALAMTMAAAVAGCGLGSWASRDLSWLGLIGTLGTLMWLQFQSDKQNTGKRLAILAAHGVFQGLGLSSFVAVLHYIDPTIVPLALLATAAIFACFSGFALLSKRRSLLYLGGTLSSVLLVLTVGGLANSLLFRSAAFASLELYAGLAMFIGYVIFDTQLIVEKAAADIANGVAAPDFVGHAVQLFVDAVAIFVRVAVILAKRSAERERAEQRRKANERR